MRIKERKSFNTGNFICQNPKAEISREQECRRIMAHYDTFHTECLEAALQKKNNTYAYVSYLQGYPGIGKSFLCEKIYRIFQNEHAKECIAIFYNLQNREQTDFALYLFDLANAFSQYVENASVFPRFSAAFSQYQKLCGQKTEAIEVETKAEAFSRNEYVSIASKALSFVPGISDVLGTADSITDLASDIYRKGTDVFYAQKYKQDFSVIDTLTLHNIQDYLLHYFILDFVSYQDELLKRKGKDRPHVIFILDTLESTAYEEHEHDQTDDYLSWLIGGNGLIHYLPNTFWLMAGREEIDWNSYDEDGAASSAEQRMQTSFDVLHVWQAKTGDILSYLTDSQSGQGIPRDFADYIMQTAAGYTFRLELCIDTYFRLANYYLQKDNSALPLSIFKEVLSEDEHTIAISKRYMMYLSKKETSLLQILACLELWTDSFLYHYIWRDDISNIIAYREFQSGNLIKRQSGLLSLQGLDSDTLLSTCSKHAARLLKEKLYLFMQEKPSDKDAFLLFYAYCNCCIKCKTDNYPETFSFDATLYSILWQALCYLLRTEKIEIIRNLAQKLGILDHTCERDLIWSYLSLFEPHTNITERTDIAEMTKKIKSLSFTDHTDVKALYCIWFSFFDVLTDLDFHYCLYIVLEKIRDILPADVPTSFLDHVDRYEYLTLANWAITRNNYQSKITNCDSQIDALEGEIKKGFLDEDVYLSEKARYESEKKVYIQSIDCLGPNTLSDTASLKEKADCFIKKAKEHNDEDSVRWYCYHCACTFFSIFSEEDQKAYQYYLDLYDQCDNSRPYNQAQLYEMQINHHRMRGDYEEIISLGLKCIRLLVDEYQEDAYCTYFLYESIRQINNATTFLISDCIETLCTEEDQEYLVNLLYYYHEQILRQTQLGDCGCISDSGKDDFQELKEVCRELKEIILFFNGNPAFFFDDDEIDSSLEKIGIYFSM